LATAPPWPSYDGVRLVLPGLEDVLELEKVETVQKALHALEQIPGIPAVNLDAARAVLACVTSRSNLAAGSCDEKFQELKEIAGGWCNAAKGLQLSDAMIFPGLPVVVDSLTTGFISRVVRTKGGKGPIKHIEVLSKFAKEPRIIKPCKKTSTPGNTILLYKKGCKSYGRYRYGVLSLGIFSGFPRHPYED